MNEFEKIKVFLHDKGYDLKKIKVYSNNDVISKTLSKQEAHEALELKQ